MKLRGTRLFIASAVMAGVVHSLAGGRFASESHGASIQKQGAAGSEQNACSSCHRQATREVFAAFSGSTHAKSGITCDACHGGDASAPSKGKAHGATFVGRPGAAETIELCSSCHTTQLEAFKTSRHFPEQAGAPRMDCAFCHGSHSIGSPASTMSFKLQCSSCHGLEYLPALPAELQIIVGVADEQKASLASILKEGREPPERLAALRKETRRVISEIIHRTDIEGARRRVPEIKRLGDEFRRATER